MASSKKTLCPHCKHTVTFRGPYHAGFSNQGFLYCDQDSTLLIFDAYNRHYERIIPNKHPWMLTQREKRLVEGNLQPCSCGGNFKFDSKPRCPHCKGEIKSLSDPIHYVVIGKEVNGNKTLAWRREAEVPGTHP